MTDVLLFIPGEPVAQPRPRASVRGSKPRVYAAKRGHPVHAWKATVGGLVAAVHHAEPADEVVDVGLDFRVSRPKSHLRKDGSLRLRAPEHPVVMDIDNLAKSVMDACNGLLWTDDRQVMCLLASKRYATCTQPPGVVVRVVTHGRGAV